MARRAKKTPINTNSKKEMALVRCLANAERYMTREQFVSIGNRAILQRWEKSGYIEQPRGGLIRATDAFFQEARHRVSGTIHNAGSGSPEHSQGIVNAIQLLPPMPFKDEDGNRLICNSQEVKDSFKDYKKSPDYASKEDAIRQNWTTQAEKAQDAYIWAQINGSSQQIEEAYKALQAAERLSERAQDHSKPIISTPDLVARMTHDELCQYAENLRAHEAELTNWRTRDQYHNAAEQVERLASAVPDGGRVELAIEITTMHYSESDIATHAAYTDITDTPVIFLPVN